MNEVPLIEKVQKNDINTTIIAIKKQLKELNALLGLIDIQSDKQDLSPYVRKDEVIDEVKRFDLSPVTSNAVANSLSYSTEEKWTGGYWLDGKPIYRKCYSGLTISFSTSEGWRTLGITAPDNVETIVKGVILGADATSPYSLHDIPFNPALVAIGSNNTLFRYNQANAGVIHSVVIEYTKTTD